MRALPIVIMTLLVAFLCLSVNGETQDFLYQFGTDEGIYKITVSLPVQNGDIIVTPHTRGVRAFALGWHEYKGVDLRDYDVLAYTPEVADPPLNRLYFPVGTGREKYRISVDGKMTCNGELYGVCIRPDKDLNDYETSRTVRYIEIAKRELTPADAVTIAGLFPNTRYLNIAAFCNGDTVAALLDRLKIEFMGWGLDDDERITGWVPFLPDVIRNYTVRRHCSDCCESVLCKLTEPSTIRFLDYPFSRLKFTLQKETIELFPNLEGIIFRGGSIPQGDFNRFMGSLTDLRILHTSDVSTNITELPREVFGFASMEHFSGNFETGIAEMCEREYESPIKWKLLSYRGRAAKPGFFGDKSSVQWLHLLSGAGDHAFGGPFMFLDEYPNIRYFHVYDMLSHCYGDRLPESLRYLEIVSFMHQKEGIQNSYTRLEELRCPNLHTEEWKCAQVPESHIKVLVTDDINAALLLQPPGGYEVLDLRTKSWKRGDEPGSDLEKFRTLKAGFFYLPYLWINADEKKCFEEIENLRTISYDSVQSYNRFGDVCDIPCAHTFGNPDWAMRHVTRVERIGDIDRQK